MIHRTSWAARRPRESGDPNAVPSRICAGGANLHFGGYGSPLSRGRRKREDGPPVLCESALIESRHWEVIAVNRAGDRSPHERSDMRVGFKTGSGLKTGSTPDIASLIRATADPGYLLPRPSGAAHSGGDRESTGDTSLLAEILARPQPDRDALQQIQGIPAQGRGANCSRPQSSHSRVHPATQSARMCQLLQACRLCFNMTGTRFSHRITATYRLRTHQVVPLSSSTLVIPRGDLLDLSGVQSTEVAQNARIIWIVRRVGETSIPEHVRPGRGQVEHDRPILPHRRYSDAPGLFHLGRPCSL